MGNSTRGRQPKGSIVCSSRPVVLSDLETTQEIRGLEPAPVLCSTPIKVSNHRRVTRELDVK